MSITRLSAIVGSCLALTACGALGQQPAPAPVTVTESVTVSPESSAERASEPAPRKTVTETAAPAPAPQPRKAAAEDLPPISNTNTHQGAKVNASGEVAEVCQLGDGYGVSIIAAGANTSCDFATNTMGALMRSTSSPSATIRDSLPNTITVHSPVTGQDYDMACSVDGNDVVVCRGGNNAAVFMH